MKKCIISCFLILFFCSTTGWAKEKRFESSVWVGMNEVGKLKEVYLERERDKGQVIEIRRSLVITLSKYHYDVLEIIRTDENGFIIAYERWKKAGRKWVRHSAKTVGAELKIEISGSGGDHKISLPMSRDVYTIQAVLEKLSSKPLDEVRGKESWFKVMTPGSTAILNVPFVVLEEDFLKVNGERIRVRKIQSGGGESKLNDSYYWVDGEGRLVRSVIENELGVMKTMLARIHPDPQEGKLPRMRILDGVVPVKMAWPNMKLANARRLKIKMGLNYGWFPMDLDIRFFFPGASFQIDGTITINTTVRKPLQGNWTLPFRNLPEEPARYLTGTPLISANSPEIAEQITKWFGDGSRDARVIASELSRRISRNIKPLAQGLTWAPAQDILSRGYGDPIEHALLFVAMARSAGIPSRMITGLKYGPGDNVFTFGTWAEYYLDEWYSLDPCAGSAWLPSTYIAMFAPQTSTEGLYQMADNLGKWMDYIDIEILEAEK